jgi:hypothetical protein
MQIFEGSLYCFHQRYVVYDKQTAATTMRNDTYPPKKPCQQVPITIPKLSIPILKRAFWYHFRVNVFKSFMDGHLNSTIQTYRYAAFFGRFP